MKYFNPTKLLTGIALLACVVFLTHCSKSDDPDKPTSTFTYVADNKVVTFTNTSKNATSYSWDFGDGNTSTNANLVNTYSNAGTYSVTLTVAGPGGSSTLVRTNYIIARGAQQYTDLLKRRAGR